jgi:hypothetical protein
MTVNSCLMFGCTREPSIRIRLDIGSMAWPMCTPHILTALHSYSAKIIARVTPRGDDPWPTR